MDKIWLNSYEEGVSKDINPDSVPSLMHYIEECFNEHRNKTCYTNMGVDLSYDQIDTMSKAFAGFLQKKCQLKKGDRVAIMMPNLLQYPIAMIGILRAGLTVVNVNPLYTARELTHQLADSGAKAIVVLQNFAHTVEKSLPKTDVKHVIVTQIGDLFPGLKGHIVNLVVKYIKKMVPAWNIPQAISFNQTINASYIQQYERPDLNGSDIAYLQYTGGTTGVSKGAMLTHRNMISNVLQATAWISPLDRNNLHGGIVTALPLYHIFSLTANCLTFLKVGIPNILITNPRDIPGFVKELKRQPFSVLTGVNTLFNALVHNEAFKQLDFSNFRFTLGGGMSVQRAVAEQWQKVTGVPLVEAYGLTEACPAVTINPIKNKTFNGSIGLPIPSTEVKIVDENGREVSIGEAGELCVRGPQVMKGYWNQPDKTAEVIIDGWLYTGDMATIDQEGFVRIVDRKKDIIIISGFNVYPNEVEDVIASLSGVKEVAVVGVDAGVQGEKVKAFIVKSDPNLTAEKVIEHCRIELTNYKVPKEVEFRDELPKTNVGKVLRRALREEK
ncbi:AMP-binding protein [Candidatus Berkiella cookevillensis]|uniref:Long-chain-fatty-acid--CoA ligase n=1 Tax=Candidatus Berkiella cookevillensis TaxID=437022 RepID=A0A0Q9YHV7_9GAMM|nr:AMP-binding protein [Candidatus Berkiella cookevillensis]